MNSPKKYMSRSLQLAKLGWGTTSPNPMVGAVVVKDGCIVGQGYHRRPGEPHAEVSALDDAGEEARGGKLYVNLEPCSHYGKTPPCTEAIIEAGIENVYASIPDPNPRVSTKGFARLSEAGIEVKTGLMAPQAQKLNEAFIKYMSLGFPFVTLKMAMSLDGKIATRTGDSRWISGQQARRWVHKERVGADAVMVGAGTAISDDPQLTPRMVDCPPGAEPVRVIVASRRQLPTDAALFSDVKRSPVLIVCPDSISARYRRRLNDAGAEVMTIEGSSDSVDLKILMGKLADREITSVLVEGGAHLAHNLVFGGMVDKIVTFIAGKLIGGKEAPTVIDGQGVETMDDVLNLNDMSVKRVGEDLCVTGYVCEYEEEDDVHWNS